MNSIMEGVVIKDQEAAAPISPGSLFPLSSKGSLHGARPIRGWVLYDDSCGFCRRWIPFWRSTLERRGYHIAPLQSPGAEEALRVSKLELLADLRLIFPNGEQIAGSDVYRHLAHRIGWAYPVYLFSIAPVCRQLFDGGYRAFARNRHRLSRACGMKGISAP